MGPNARTLLGRVGAADTFAALAPEQLRFATTREIDLGFARVRAARMSYVGGPGFELYVPIEMARHVWLALHEASEGLGVDGGGLADAGYYALDALRIEAGRRAWGAELGPDETPFEAGTMFAVKLAKADDFIGQAALVRMQGRRRCARSSSPSCSTRAMPGSWGGEALVVDGEAVGEISSAGWSDAAGRCVALGYVRGAAAARVHAGASIAVDLWGDAVAASTWDFWSPASSAAPAATLDWFHASVHGPLAPHRPRSHPRSRRPDGGSPARRLGREGRQDRDAGGAGRRRRRRRPARGQRLPQRPPQQARHDAEPEVGRGRRHPQEAGAAGRRAGRELPPRREAKARHRLRDDGRGQPAPRLRQHLGLRRGRAVPPAAGLRPDRAGHGRPDVDHRAARPGPGARRHPDRRPLRRHLLRLRHRRRRHRAREVGPRPVGQVVAAAGAALHARLPGGALADERRGRRSRRATTIRPRSRPASIAPATAT